MGFPISYVIGFIGYRGTIAVGAVLFPLALFLASISTQLWQTILTHGILLGLGSSFCFCGSFVLLTQWFVKHRGLVNGISATGTGFGSMCFSPLSEYLIRKFGFRIALRVLGGILFVLLAIATALARPRYPPPASRAYKQQQQQQNITSSLYWKFLLNKPYVLLITFSIFAPFGYIIPLYLMPSYAVQVVGVGPSTGSILVSAASAANIISRIAFAAMADRMGQINIMFLTTFVSSLLIMLMWQVSYTLVPYALYCVLLGLTTGLYIPMLTPVTARLVGMKHLYICSTFAWMAISIGSLIGTPCFGQLQAKFGYSVAIQFAGGATLFSSLCMLGIRFLLDRRLICKV
ncbi:MFS general substrate transporter [Lichtheimia hyalospora FSU 10163]|nr:MFS general substrate transporter [Lichtheimia hyalospora FSU 10163]